MTLINVCCKTEVTVNNMPACWTWRVKSNRFFQVTIYSSASKQDWIHLATVFQSVIWPLANDSQWGMDVWLCVYVHGCVCIQYLRPASSCRFCSLCGAAGVWSSRIPTWWPPPLRRRCRYLDKGDKRQRSAARRHVFTRVDWSSAATLWSCLHVSITDCLYGEHVLLAAGDRTNIGMHRVAKGLFGCFLFCFHGSTCMWS